MNTNAKTIGVLLVLCISVIGSTVVAQTPAAMSDANAGITDVRKQSGELLRQARTAMKGGNLVLAERLIAQSEKLGTEQSGILSRFSDSPAKARKDLAKLKQSAGVEQQVPQQLAQQQLKGNVIQLPPNTPQGSGMQAQAAVQARSVMAQAKAAFDRGDLDLSESLVQQAAKFQVTDSNFSGGDTPWELNMKIQKQRRLSGTGPAPIAGQLGGVVAPVSAIGSNRKVAAAVYDPSTDQTYVRQVGAEELLPPVETLAQQVRGLNPLMQQPAPVTLQGEALPGTPIPFPNNTNGSFQPGPATAGPTTTSPAPAATTFQAVPQEIQEPTEFDLPSTQPATTGFTDQPLAPTPSNQFAPVEAGITTLPATTGYGISPQELIKLGEEQLRDRELEKAQDYFRQAWAMQDQLDAQTRQRLQEHLQLIQSGIKSEGTEDNEEEREESARLNRLLADVSREQASIRREVNGSPKESWEKMKDLRVKLSDADLPSATRGKWLEKIDADISEIERFIEQNRAQIELDDTNREVLALIDRERKMKVDIQNQLATSVEEFNTLMHQQRYSEAYVLARQAREIAPNHEVTESMLWKARFAERMYVNINLQDRRDRMFEYGNDPGELDVPDAFTLSRPMEFPKNWKEMSISRQGALADIGSRYNEAEQAIERALSKRVQVQFDEAPLGEVIETLGRMTGVNVFIDTEGLAAEGVTTDTPVTMNLSQEISLESVLNLILGQYRLGFVIQDEVLRITSESARAGDVRTQPYYVGDLVIPIPNFMPGHNNGLAGALAQAYSALGYGPGGFAQNRTQNSPLVIADNGNQQQNVGSPLALAQMNTSNSMPSVPGMPQPPGAGGMGGASGADFDSLINLITSTVEPDSWDDVGGPGTVQPFDGNLSLVVSNTQEVHDAIVSLLEQLRRLQDLQVTIEVRFVTLQDNFFERIGVDFDFDINDNTGLTNADLSADTFQEDGSDITIGLDPSGNPTVDLDLSFSQNHFGAALPQFGGFAPGIASSFGFAILSDIEAFFLIEAIQGDSRTNVMQAPKVTLFNGQFATINDTQNRPFVTSVIPVVGDFAVAQQPVIMVLAEGTQLSVQAVVSSDRRFVRLTMLPMFSQIGDVDTFTFEGRRSSTTGSTTETDPDNEDGTVTNLNDELFTEGTTVQLPNFATTSVSTTVSVPDGGTVLMGGIKRLAEGRTERGMPILSKLPYINRLFKNVGTGRETQTLMMMVTPRIIIQEEEEEKVIGTPSP